MISMAKSLLFFYCKLGICNKSSQTDGLVLLDQINYIEACLMKEITRIEDLDYYSIISCEKKMELPFFKEYEDKYKNLEAIIEKMMRDIDQYQNNHVSAHFS